MSVTVGEAIDALKAETEKHGLSFRASFCDEADPGEAFRIEATDLDELASFSMHTANGEHALALRVFAAALAEWKGAALQADPCAVPGCVRIAGHPSFHCTSDQIAKKEDGR